MRKSAKKFLILFLIHFLFFSGCLAANRKPPASRELVIVTATPIGEISPFSRSGLGANLIALLHPSLFQVDSEGRILPILAQEVTWENKGRDLKIRLKDPLAKDVKETVEQFRKLSQAGFQEGLKYLQEISLISDREIIFHLKRFDRSFIFLLSEIPIVAFSKEDTTTGEFRLGERNNEELVFIRKNISPDKVNTIRVKTISSPRRALREIIAGNADLLLAAEKGDYEILKDLPEIKIASGFTKVLYLLLENREKNKASSLLNWASLNRSLDRKSLLGFLPHERVSEAYLPVPLETISMFNGFDREFGSIQQASLKNRSSRMLTFQGRQGTHRKIARLLRRRFEEIGVDLKLKDLADPGEFFKQVLLEKNFDLVLLHYQIRTNIPYLYLLFHSPEGTQSPNFSGYKNAGVDRFLELARFTQDEKKARQAFQKAMLAMFKDPPGLFLFWRNIPIVYRARCSGFQFSANLFFYSLKGVRCEG